MRALRSAALLLALSALSGCALGHGFLYAAGPVARSEREMFLIVLAVMMFVIVPIWIAAPLVAWHYRLRNSATAYRPNWDFNWWIEASIWIPPTLIVAGLGWLMWVRTAKLDPYKPLALAGPPLEIQAVSLDWKWLFIYPSQHVAALNALVIPVGRPVSISMTSATVMQSLFIPRLAGQIYTMAGMTTRLHLAADTPGAYVGENTQYNGDGFQEQKFIVTAMPPARFEAWVAGVHRDGQSFDAAAQDRLFKRSTPNQPVLYNGVSDGFFKTVLDRYKSGVRAAISGQQGKQG